MHPHATIHPMSVALIWPQGATVFLDAPKSQQDSAKLIPAEQLMLGPPAAQQP